MRRLVKISRTGGIGMENEKYKYKVITIPNVLSFVRVAMIPFFVWTYIRFVNGEGSIWIPFGILLLSGFTDIVDGFIARQFGMVSNVGRILDPIADKLTQLAVLACLCLRYHQLILPVCLLVVKEVANGIIGLVMMHLHRDAIDSKWHGKLTTVVIYLTIVVHLLWPVGKEIPTALSYSLIGACIFMMVLSFTLYTINNVRIIREFRKSK